jgi:hypothetical protein
LSSFPTYRDRISVAEIVRGAPYGATTVVGCDGSRQPTEIDLSGARHQGELVAKDGGQAVRLTANKQSPFITPA